MFSSLSRRCSSGGWRLCRCWRCLRHYSVTTMIARFFITAGLTLSPFGLLIAGLDVIITNTRRLYRAFRHSMPLLVTPETSYHALLVAILGRLEADGALPLHDPVDCWRVWVALVHRFSGPSICYVVKVAGTGGMSGWLAVTTKPSATSLLLLMLRPPPLIVGRGM